MDKIVYVKKKGTMGFCYKTHLVHINQIQVGDLSRDMNIYV